MASSSPPSDSSVPPVAVVVGGSGGIGSGICRRLAADGHRVVVGYASGRERAEALVAELGTDHRALVAHDDLDSLDDELIDRIFAVNWRGPFAAIRSFRSLLEAASDPVVINISSVAAVTGLGSNVAYCASKAALDSLTRSLGRALAPTIRVVSVSPGWVEGEYAASMPPGFVDGQREATPLKRLASPDNVAGAVSAVIRDLTCTTGVAIPVDGGRPLGV